MNDITPKEAIINLNHIYGMVSPDIQRSLDVAIKALENPSGDCISRYDAVIALNEAQIEGTPEYRGLGKAKQIIDGLQAVEMNALPKIHYDRGFNAGYDSGKNARPQGEWRKGFIYALDKAFLMFDASCTYSGERVLQILEKLKWLEKLKEEKGGAE